MIGKEYKEPSSIFKISNIIIFLLVLSGLTGLFYVLTNSGISGLGSLFENIQINSVNCDRIYKDESYFWRITIVIQNKGSTQIKVNQVLVENTTIPYGLNQPDDGEAYTNVPASGINLNINEVKMVQISLGYKFLGKTPLDLIKIMIKTDSGKDYSTVLTLT